MAICQKCWKDALTHIGFSKDDPFRSGIPFDEFKPTYFSLVGSRHPANQCSPEEIVGANGEVCIWGCNRKIALREWPYPWPVCFVCDHKAVLGIKYTGRKE